MSTPTTHKLAKGDTLESIAKKYKSDAKLLWKAPENKAIVSKRGKPEALQPGDVLVIPQDPKEAKAAAAKAEMLREGRDAAMALLKSMELEAERSKRRVRIYLELLDYNATGAKDVVGELAKTKADMKRWADGVDTAAMVAQITVAMASLCSKGAQATKLSGEALEKMNAEMTKDVLKLPGDQLEGVGIKFLGELRERADSPLGYVGTLASSWEKMTSPSFWANTFVQMKDNGKSWSDAVSMDVGQDIDDRIRETAAQFQQQDQKLKKQLAEAKAGQADIDRMIAECKARIRWAEAEAQKL